MMTIIPVDDIRELPLAELAVRLLGVLRGGNINPNSTLRGLEQALDQQQISDADHLMSRIASAWAWLEAHGLIGPHPRNTRSEWQQLTEVGVSVAADPHALTKVYASERLGGHLNPLLASARSNFDLGDYETACFAAMKAVEVEVRRVAGLPNELVGVPLMRKAFSPKDGRLTDPGAEGGEQQATANLFAGAMGVFKNPASHRTVQFDDPMEAAEVIQLSDLLLRIIDRARRRLDDST